MTICLSASIFAVQPESACSSLEKIENIKEGGSAKIEKARRAALDIGSSGFKLLVADYDLNTHEIKTVFSTIIRVSLGSDLAASIDGMFSEMAIQKALEAISQLKNQAIEHGATEFSGIATAAMRNAKNGADLLEKMNRIFQPDRTVCKKEVLQVVTQENEGKIGFYAVAAMYPELDRACIVAADMGNSSIQFSTMTSDGLQVYEIPAGTSSFAKALIENVRSRQYFANIDCNPIHSHEVLLLKKECLKLLPKVPAWLTDKLSQSNTLVVGLADFALGPRAVKKDNCTFDDLSILIPDFCNRLSSDPKITSITISPSTAVIRLIITHTLMETLGISTLSYRETLGSTQGIILLNELW